MGTRQRILESAVSELEDVGPTRFRLKHVATSAEVSQSLISAYFSGREGLIAAATVERFTMTQEAFFDPFRGLEEFDLCPDTLRSILPAVFLATLDEDRRHLRTRMVEAIAVLQHNPEAAQQIADVKDTANEEMLKIALRFENEGLLAEGVSAVAFARVFYSVLFGQVVVENADAFALTNEEWVETLLRLVSAFMKDDVLTA